MTSPHDRDAGPPNDDFDEPVEELSSIVRAYARTGGRTRPRRHLEIETLVSATTYAQDRIDELPNEHREIARLCGQAISVAEISALLALPLGTVRVLVDDMDRLGLVDVHHNPATFNDRPDLELMERVLRGLENLEV